MHTKIKAFRKQLKTWRKLNFGNLTYQIKEKTILLELAEEHWLAKGQSACLIAGQILGWHDTTRYDKP